jgi:protein-S-isoprenylcysteine O-methyltransferase Ste14
MAWSIFEFWRAEANIRPDRAATTLITSGPFAIWRNPIYMADAMLLAGLAQVTLNIWFVPAAALFAMAVYTLAILPEEAHLEARFGDAYRDYIAHSRRWF